MLYTIYEFFVSFQRWLDMRSSKDILSTMAQSAFHIRCDSIIWSAIWRHFYLHYGLYDAFTIGTPFLCTSTHVTVLVTAQSFEFVKELYCTWENVWSRRWANEWDVCVCVDDRKTRLTSIVDTFFLHRAVSFACLITSFCSRMFVGQIALGHGLS